MSESQTKRHHLIPRTYLSSWEHNKGTLYVKYRDETIKERNKDKIAYVTDFHSIFVDMPICTKEDTDKIFECLSNYTVEYNGKIVTDTLELNKIYYDFENWKITRQDGSTVVNKKRLKNDIECVKIRDIETLWGTKYENGWNDLKEKIECAILSASTDIIPAFEKENLMKFYTAMDWRGFKNNKQLNDMFNWLCNDVLQFNEIEIPENERKLPMIKNAADELKHSYLLKQYREFFNNDGVIYKNAMANLQYTSFHFLVADGIASFITSDNPAFVFNCANGKHMGIMPITSKILLLQGKDTDKCNEYSITHVGDDEVKLYNNIIRDNSVEFVIMDKPNGNF